MKKIKDMSFITNGPSPLLGIFRKGKSKRKIKKENKAKRIQEYIDNRNSGMNAEEALNSQDPSLT